MQDEPQTGRNMMILAGDIGGTNTRLGIFTATRGPNHPLVTRKYPSRAYDGLEEVVRHFMGTYDVVVQRASFGVAGPIKDNRSAITNLSWVIDGDALGRTTGIGDVALLNDLEAMAYAIPNLDAAMLETINPGVPVTECVKALIAPGTGLGEVFLTWCGGRYRSHGSEGGHTEFGPRNALEMALLDYLLQFHEHVSYERVCSGMGLPNLYAFLRDTGRCPEPPGFARRLARAADPTPVIVNAALDDPKNHSICVAALKLFTAILGAEAGNLAMTVSAYSGVYIGGGIPPRIADYIRSERFLAAFQNKGRLRRMIAGIPIYLVTHPDTALMGAACHALGL
jgi:glucokinase